MQENVARKRRTKSMLKFYFNFKEAKKFILAKVHVQKHLDEQYGNRKKENAHTQVFINHLVGKTSLFPQKLYKYNEEKAQLQNNAPTDLKF
jgi:hypothetical protein